MDELPDELAERFSYEKAGFSVEADRAIVRGFIESAHGSVESFQLFLADKLIDLDPSVRQHYHV